MVTFFGAAMAAFLICAVFVIPGRLRQLMRIPNHEELARRAYELFLARGGEAGHDVDDWLQAEREFRSGAWIQAAIGVAMLIMFKMLKRIAYTWVLLSFAGLALYVAFCAALRVDMNVFAILAVVFFALAISILLALDDDQPRSEEKLENMTFAGLGYVLLVKRKPLLAALVLTLVAIGLTVYYLSKSMGITLETEGSSLTIKLPGQEIHYIPIHSQLGWQNTGIKLKAGQKVQYSITGAVSPGYLQDIDIRSELLRKLKLGQITEEQYTKAPPLKWPFTGPEGYGPQEYTDLKNWDKEDCKKQQEEVRKRCTSPMAQQDPKDCDPKQQEEVRKRCEEKVTKDEDYKHNTGLTVQGVPHNRVMGITLSGGTSPRPGYDYQKDEDKAQLIEFKVEQRETTTKQAGVLWVVINDAGLFRWDNAGLFFMKLVIP